MEIRLGRDDRLTLENPNEFGKFKLVIEHPKTDLPRVRKLLGDIARLSDEGTAWVSEIALRRWPGHIEDHAWQHRLGEMIEKAKPHGWIDEATQAIRAHVEWRGEGR